MANLKEIRTRIGSVSSTMKITSAMKMVSAAKFKKAQNALLKFRPFHDQILNLVQGLTNTKGIGELEYIKPRKRIKNIAILLITSSNSMCGAFNANIIKEAKHTYERMQMLYPKASIKFYCLGKKGEDALRREGYKVKALNHDFIDKPSIQATKTIFNDIFVKYKEGEIDRIDIVYNRFNNAASQELISDPFLPLANISSSSAKKTRKGKQSLVPPLFEPAPEALLSKLFPYFLLNRLHDAILESSASEHGARMTAMHQATENASSLYNELLLEYNKARQAAITNEIVEIVSGANALNG